MLGSKSKWAAFARLFTCQYNREERLSGDGRIAFVVCEFAVSLGSTE